jgi:hypothetical protein
MLGSKPGQLRLRHWLSDALTTRLHLIFTDCRSVVDRHRFDSDPDLTSYFDADPVLDSDPPVPLKQVTVNTVNDDFNHTI